MGCVYKLEYHIVFVVKYRKRVFIDDNMDLYLKFLLNKIAEENGILIHNMETDKDHIHMLVELKPTHYIPRVIQLFKGITSRNLRKTFNLSKLNNKSFWSPSYFVCTVSENSRENIKKYIDNQRNKWYTLIR